MQAFAPVEEKQHRPKIIPLIPVKEEANKPEVSSLRPIEKSAAGLSTNRYTGVNPWHVTAYALLALLAGFGIGFATAQFMGSKENAAKSLTADARSPRELPAASPTAALDSNEFYPVSRLVRADTIEVEGVGPVRMIGIETPDGKPPEEGYGPYGQQALTLTEILLLDAEVRLELDPSAKAAGDEKQAGPTLAYVYKKDGTLINGELLKQGLALVRSGEEFRLSELFRSLEREAMQSLRGIWSASTEGLTPPANPNASISTPVPPGKKTRLSPLAPSEIGPDLSTTAGGTAGGPLVFVSGDRQYHNKRSCDLLGKQNKTLGLSQAKGQGYTACSSCYPSHTMQVK